MSNVIIACIGGFLGAGKTTTLQRAAEELKARGMRVGVITNDQGSDLVDTMVLRSQGVSTEEIAGGCFCCKFDELVAAAGTILDRERPDIILAEAVGSCTDLSATVYQPLRRYYGQKFDLAPLSILVEPGRIGAFEGHGAQRFPDSVRYLFEKQLAEADLILLNKVDIIDERARVAITQWIRDTVGDVPVHPMSALTGEGVSGWVDRLLDGGGAGGRTLDVDYKTYAEAEAALGWLNTTIEVTAGRDFPPKDFAEAFIRHVQRSATATNVAIAHLKAFVATSASSDRIAVTENRADIQWSGPADFVAVDQLSMVINARVGTSPDQLSKLIDHSLETSARAFGLCAAVRHRECFSPQPPVPRHRFAGERP
jgi:G3E family GTPase